MSACGNQCTCNMGTCCVPPRELLLTGRSRSALPRQSQHHCNSTCAQIRQQPYRQSRGRHHRQPRRGLARCRCRHGMRSFPHREAGRRVSVSVILDCTASSLLRYFTFLDKCSSPKACTILLRGPSKDILNEIDRNLADAMSVARNVVFNPILAPGGGATEMAISVALSERAKTLPGVAGAPYKAIADALEVIPRTLVQNCGGNAIRTLTELRVSYFSPFPVHIEVSETS